MRIEAELTPDEIEFWEGYAEYSQMEYEQRPWKVTCQCGRTAFTTQQTLELVGWQLGPGPTELCPRCSAKFST